MGTINLADNQKVQLDAQFKDAAGNPTQPVGTPVWSTDRSDLVTLQPLNGGASCEISAVGPTGTANVTCEDTNGQGETFHDDITVVIQAGEAASVQVVAEVPQDQ